MTVKQIAPYGTWVSPISAQLIAGGSIKLSQTAINKNGSFWLESRPSEKGRSVLVFRDKQGKTQDATGADMNVRSAAHEYGGGAFIVDDRTIYFTNFADGGIYRSNIGEDAQLLLKQEGSCYADFCLDKTRNRLLYVREDYSLGGEPISTIDFLNLDGSGKSDNLICGADFFSSVRVSVCGRFISWLSWSHPNMPWDATKLWMANLCSDGSLANIQQVAGTVFGGAEISIAQPEWGPDGTLYYISDESGYWNLYACYSGLCEQLISMEAEFCQPQWVFGQSSYAVANEKELVLSYNQRGLWKLATFNTETRQLAEIETPFEDLSYIKAENGQIIFRGGSAKHIAQIVLVDKLQWQTLRKSVDLQLDGEFLSHPASIEFPTTGDCSAFAFYYAPTNKNFASDKDTKPPLIVKSHGGPTSACTNTLDLGIQYWTSRGFAVVDVNYRGSTGFGRTYRDALRGKWGVSDVDDCVSAAKFLIEQGLVDAHKLIIAGGSAGGFTTLSALTFRDMFKAGASYYGISDLLALARDTHKFESRYLDRLLGPLPESIEIYKKRSPINYSARLKCPVIFFQGLDDKAVPPEQSEKLYQSLKKLKIATAYFPFEGEGHGFRKSETIKRCLEEELKFYLGVFAIENAEKSQVGF